VQEILVRGLMGDEELVSFILRSREKGRSDEQITRALLSVGWQKDRVVAAFNHIAEMKSSGELAEYVESNAEGAVRGQQKPTPAPIRQPQAGSAPPMQGSQAQQEQAAAAQPALEAQPVPVQQIQSTQMQARPESQQQAAVTGGQPVAKKPLFSIPFIVKKAAQPVAEQGQQAAKKPLFVLPRLFGSRQSPVQQVRESQPSQQEGAPAQQVPPSQPGGEDKQSQFYYQPSQAQPFSTPQQPVQQQPQDKEQNAAVEDINRYLRLVTSSRLIRIGAAAIFLVVVVIVIYFVFLHGGVESAAAAGATIPAYSPPPESQPSPEPPAQAGASTQENNSSQQSPAAQLGAAQISQAPPQPTSSPPVQPAPNQSGNSSAQVQQAASSASNIPVVIVPQPNSTNSSNQSQNATYSRTRRFFTSGPFSPDRYCQNEGNGTLINIHYKVYFGSECTSEKPGIEGFVDLAQFRENCKILPCCFANSPLKSNSTRYDWFECGY
jgi:hypothetical protein